MCGLRMRSRADADLQNFYNPRTDVDNIPSVSSQPHCQCTLAADHYQQVLGNDYVTAFLLAACCMTLTMALTANQLNLLNRFLFQQLQLP